MKIVKGILFILLVATWFCIFFFGLIINGIAVPIRADPTVMFIAIGLLCVTTIVAGIISDALTFILSISLTVTWLLIILVPNSLSLITSLF